MDSLHLFIIFGAGVIAGLMNAIAGGGTIITFPALIFAGIPSIPANATSTVALIPSALGYTFGYRKNIPAVWHWIKLFALRQPRRRLHRRHPPGADPPRRVRLARALPHPDSPPPSSPRNNFFPETLPVQLRDHPGAARAGAGSSARSFSNSSSPSMAATSAPASASSCSPRSACSAWATSTR